MNSNFSDEQTPVLFTNRRFSNQKFLSIKSIIRNKKIVVKKNAASLTFYHPHISSTAALIDQKSQLPYQNISSQKKYYPTSATNKNVVNIQFVNQLSSDRISPVYDQKLRRKGINSLALADSEKKQQQQRDQKTQTKICNFFQESLHIEPLQKPQQNIEVLANLERKKGFQQYITITKRKKMLGNHLQVSKINKSNRTISELKPIGKQIPLNLQKEKNKMNRRTVTAFNKKNNCQSVDEEKKQTWYISKFRESPRKQAKNQQSDLPDVKREKQKRLLDQVLLEFKDYLPLRRPVAKKDYFVFGMSDKPTIEPENKIEFYRDFLWKINYSNSIHVQTPETLQFSYKAYFGFGNNSCMLKSIMRRRYWWNIIETTNSLESCQFVWTQLKVNSLFKTQNVNQIPGHIDQIPQEKQIYQDIRNLNKPQDDQKALQVAHTRIFNCNDWKNFQIHLKKNAKTEQKFTEQTYAKRIGLYTKKKIAKIADSTKLRMHNHLQFNFYLGNKKALFYNMKRLCECKGLNPFDYIPVTFHVCKGIQDPSYERFMSYRDQLGQKYKNDKNFKNIWICKPGENTNRGNGISVCFGIDDIKLRLRGKQRNSDGKARTFIFQKYIQRPFLYKNRKFDIRHYILLTCFNGQMKAYWFDEGYIRTSSSQFNLKDTKDIMVHLTNDAVQKKSQAYGKHEKGNKISYEDFQKYLDAKYRKKKYNFLKKTLKKMKQITLLAVQATYSLLDPKRKQHNFELIGLDFMIDQNFTPWLIEANTNPCLELSCPLLQKLLPNLIEQLFRICIDPFFPPPQNFINKKQFFGENPLLQNRFELIFDEVVDGQRIQNMLNKGSQKEKQQFSCAIGRIEEDDEVFEDDGDEKWEEKQN